MTLPIANIARTALQLSLLLLLYWTANVSVAAAQSAHIIFVASKNSAPYNRVIETASAQLQENYQFETYYLEQNNTGLAKKLAASSLIISVGTNAARAVFPIAEEKPLIAVLITRSGFISLAKKHFGSVENSLQHKISAIYLDQPISRFLNLAALLMPEAKKLGIMLGPIHKNNASNIEVQAKTLFPETHLAKIGKKDHPIHTLEPSIKNSELFIALPDRKSINRNTAKWILQLSHRHKVPVIAFSKKYADAGALASIYASPDDVGRQLANMIANKAYTERGIFTASDHFSIQLNAYIAKALNIQLLTPAQYRQQVLTLEKEAMP